MVSLVAFLTLRFVSEGTAEQHRSFGAPFQTASSCAGDSNLDGLRDVLDLVLIQSFLLDQRTLEADALSNADANQDSEVDVRDIVALLQHTLGASALPDCDIVFPDEPPSIRFITPSKGPAGTQFTLVGRGFSPTRGLNRVFFSRPGKTLAATLTAASANALWGTVPNPDDLDLYRVTVRVGGVESNGAGFQLSTTPPPLDLFPSSLSVLLPPGSGKETLAIGGGVPPYTLKPLDEFDAETIQVELKDTLIAVTGFRRGTVTLEVEDSGETPDTDQATLVVRDPLFEPTFEVVPHTLLAGARPGFTFLISHLSNHMRVVEAKIRMDPVTLDLESLVPGLPFALGKTILFRSPRDFLAFKVSEVLSPNEIRFEAARIEDNALEIAAEGSVESGSALLTLRQLPRPSPESLVQVRFEQEILLDHELVELPPTGQNFDITASFTSVTVLDGEDMPLAKTLTRSFTTETPPPGAPRLEQLRPVLGPIGAVVTMTGSGFDPDPENNLVTFPTSDGSREEGQIESASANELKVRVPQDAVSGKVRVSVGGLQSNDYWFFVLFRPLAAIFLGELIAGQPVAPLLLLGQEEGFRTLVTDRDVRLASLRVVLDAGGIGTDDLILDQPAGVAQLLGRASGASRDYLLVYGGQEQEDQERHFFDLKKSLEERAEATLFFSEDDAGGVVFEMTPSFSLLGSTLEIRFEAAVYVPPESAATTINIRSVVRSQPWNFFPESEMVVTFLDEARTQ